MISKAETETIFRIAEDEKSWTVFTESKSMVKRLLKIGAVLTKDGEGVRCTIPRKAIKIRMPKILTETQKEAIRDRFAKNKVNKAIDAYDKVK